jgi:hypothetical protein
MLDSPDQEWRRLTAHYAEMWDGELLNVAADYKDLTDTARQVLRDEMRKRDLGDPAVSPSQPRNDSTAVFGVPRKQYDFLAGPLVPSYIEPDDKATIREEQKPSGDDRFDYTWKTRLCDCDDLQQAQQLSLALENAGIESWIEAMPGYAIGVGSPHVLVPADRLEEAHRVMALPIPQDIIDESKVEIPDFEMPRCPRCHNQDPTLVGTEPSNQWHCESCSKEWTDPVAEPEQA